VLSLPTALLLGTLAFERAMAEWAVASARVELALFHARRAA
jgi:hypothetical protein